eukprot:1396822-Prorocentrum_lima.AAC.1
MKGSKQRTHRSSDTGLPMPSPQASCLGGIVRPAMIDCIWRSQTSARTACWTHVGACQRWSTSMSQGHWTLSKALAWSAKSTAG